MMNESKSFHLWCEWEGAFSNEEVDEVVKYCSSKPLTKGIIGGGEDTQKRSSNVNFHDYSQDTQWIFDRLVSVAKQLNILFYNFELIGFDYFQYSEYNSNSLDRYNFHMDMIFGDNCVKLENEFRKLSLVMLLNEPMKDFEGGDFEMSFGSDTVCQKIELTKGKIILFPSFLIHRVTPVTKGIRKSLVTWIQGPKFR